MSKVKRFSLEERYGYQNRKVIYDKNADDDIELNNIYPIIDLLNQLDELKQTQKQLAVNELEKLKENAWQLATDISCLLDYTELVRIIDNQIKSLKGEE